MIYPYFCRKNAAMLKKIVGTAGTRILNALVNLAILFLITNHIGKEGLGAIGLILLDVGIIQLVIDLVAGSALIYYASREATGKLFIPAYLWIAVVSVSFYFIFQLLKLYFPVVYSTVIPDGTELTIIGLAVINSLMLTHYNLLLGHEQIKTYNMIFTTQVLIVLIVFLVHIFFLGQKTVDSYISSLFAGYTIAAFFSFFALLKSSRSWSVHHWADTTRKVIRYGMVTQIANVLHIGNKRFSFYIIKRFMGLPPLGIYTAGVQLTEGLRLIGQSISIVQFATLSNTTDKKYAAQLTIKLMKFTVLLTFAAVLVLIILPESFYTWIFSKAFTGVKPVILILSPGVIALAANAIFSHYFSGLGNPKVNLWSNVVGFVLTLILAFSLIPLFGINGAAATASVSYISTVIYQYIVFKKQTGTRFGEWIPRKQDIRDFRGLIQDAFFPGKVKG